MLKNWIKGILLGGAFTLLPAAAFPSTYSDWRLWFVFALMVVLIGTNPPVKYVKVTDNPEEARDQGSLKLILIAGYLSVLVPVTHYFWNAAHPHPDCGCSMVPVIAAAVGALGLAFRIWAIRVLGNFFTAQVVIQDSHQLCKRGPYRWIRHPSYTGALFLFHSIPFLLGVWIWVIPMILVWAYAYYRRIGSEEAALTQHFGEAYVQYKKQSWALLPPIF